MKGELIIGVIAILAVSYFVANTQFGTDVIDTEYTNFIAQYRRNYKSSSEYEFRRSIFKKNYEYIQKFNSEGRTWWLGVNNFADMTKEEVKKYMGFAPSFGHSDSNRKLGVIDENTPETGPNDVDLDWRHDPHAVLQKVKNQGACGSCWAFAANAGVETAWVMYKRHQGDKNFTAPDLSEQLLVDCDTNSAGCMGGFMDNAYYLYTHTHPEFQQDYPYEAKDLDCRAGEHANATDLLLGWYEVNRFDDESLRKTLNLGPVPVAIQAENQSFYLYKGGIISGTECGYQLDHGVSLIAEHIDGQNKTWTIKNSWGPVWGEGGYARIAREEILVQGYNVGVCGINMQNSIPTYMQYFH